ncbi:hypothetical protein ACIQ9R_36445 [Streptomyces sp. NPDC094447]|uniref:hypothetical protein n=1 Tax=Streptomyces sp. NPDC094447 TaxID=3366062 RepID=UPI0037F395CD
MTTNIKKTAAADTAEQPTEDITLVGPPLRHGQTAEKVTFAHHLRVGGKEVRPGDTAHVSPDYARQLRSSGYLARTRG